MNISTNPWVWFMGLGMVSLYSFIYKENPIYRLFEHIYVGASVGYTFVTAYGNIIDQAWTPLTTEGKLNLLIPIVLGLMLYTRFFKPIAWVSRWPMSFLMGLGVGISTHGLLQSQLIAQSRAAMAPLFVKSSEGALLLGPSINNIIMVLGVLGVLFYFFFSVEHKGPVRKMANLGRIVMMITFGVAFGNVVMGRISLLLGTISDIFGTWLGII
ncbi:MAG: hypothetical protein GX033_04055 [Firmicutes bacterium]|nr:hypothetical protein [Bacillota bacterium]